MQFFTYIVCSCSVSVLVTAKGSVPVWLLLPILLIRRHVRVTRVSAKVRIVFVITSPGRRTILVYLPISCVDEINIPHCIYLLILRQRFIVVTATRHLPIFGKYVIAIDSTIVRVQLELTGILFWVLSLVIHGV